MRPGDAAYIRGPVLWFRFAFVQRVLDGLVELHGMNSQPAITARLRQRVTHAINRQRQHPPLAIVHVLTDQVHAAGSAINPRLAGKLRPKLFAERSERRHSVRRISRPERRNHSLRKSSTSDETRHFRGLSPRVRNREKLFTHARVS